MKFQKVHARATKYLSFSMGMIFSYMTLVILCTLAFGPNRFAQWLLEDKVARLAWMGLFFGWLSFTLIKDFFYYRKKMMAGVSDQGLCVWNEPTSSYVFIPWPELENVGVSFGFGGSIGCYGEGLLVLSFKQAVLCKVDNKSSYAAEDGSCDLNILSQQEISAASCTVDFGYWSWQPYVIKKEVNTRRQASMN